MPRIRSIKPEFWDSPGTAKASLRGRLFYIALWNWADDWGVGDANPRRLLGFAFPNDESSEVEPRNFRRLAEEASECFDVQWYEVDGRPYYAIPSWESHQRTEKKARRAFPGPDQAERPAFDLASELPTPSVGKARDGAGEQGNGGTGEREEDTSSEVADATPRPDVDDLLNYLDAAIRANDAKIPSRTKANVSAARLLLDKDGHTPEQVRAAIDFATTDSFWRANVLSMSKLREKYDQLRLAAQRPGRPAPRTRQDDNRDVIRRVAIRDGHLPDDTLPLQIGARP